MGTVQPRVLVTMDGGLLAAVDAAAAAEGVSRSEWVRETCRRRLGVAPPIGGRVVSARLAARSVERVVVAEPFVDPA